MEIQTVVTGMLRENCYIITKNGLTLIVDPGDDFEKIKKAVENKKVVGILITHHHFDHIGVLKELKEYLNIEENSHIDGFEYSIIETPGHSKDSVSYYFKSDKCLFTGDFLFKGTIGRMDLKGGSREDMKNSLNKIRDYDDEIIIYPGHGPTTSLGKEKPFFEEYLSDFVRFFSS